MPLEIFILDITSSVDTFFLTKDIRLKWIKIFTSLSIISDFLKWQLPKTAEK